MESQVQGGRAPSLIGPRWALAAYLARGGLEGTSGTCLPTHSPDLIVGSSPSVPRLSRFTGTPGLPAVSSARPRHISHPPSTSTPVPVLPEAALPALH